MNLAKIFPAFRNLFLATGIFFGLTSCHNSSDKSEEGTLQPIPLKYAAFFKIYKCSDHLKLVTYLNSSKSDSAEYILYSGQKPNAGMKVYYVHTPVNKVACMSSVFVGFLHRLNKISSITAVDNLDFISNPGLLNPASPVHELSKNAQMNIEKALLSGAQVIFTNPSGDKKKDFDERLVHADIIPVVCADYFENDPLGRAEWIKALALFFDRAASADSLFAQTEQRYHDMQNKVKAVNQRPTVFTELKTNDAWFIAGGKSSMAKFIADAGGDYLWKDNGKIETTAMNMEQVVAKALNADYWINLHLCTNKTEVLKLDQRYGEFNAFKVDHLYNNNANLNAKGGNAFWEDGLCNPDEILSDLVKIFHPAVLPDHQLKYYRQLK